MDAHFVAMLDIITDPLRHVFGCRIESADLVEVLVVKLVMDITFDMSEVDNHAIGIKRL